MKVRYLTDYSDESVAPGYVFRRGWTAEHDSSTGLARIQEGVCVEIEPDARSRKLDLSADLEFMCIPVESPASAPLVDDTRPTRRRPKVD